MEMIMRIGSKDENNGKDKINSKRNRDYNKKNNDDAK